MGHRASRAFAGIALVTIVAMPACGAPPTSPEPIETRAVSGEVVVIDVPAQRLYLQWGTAAFFKVSVTEATRFKGAAASMAGIAALYQGGYQVHVDASGFGFDPTEVDATTVTVIQSGPFPMRIQTAYNTYRDWFGVPALQFEKTIVMFPPDAIVEPASEIPSLEALFDLAKRGVYVCVLADTYTMATVSYRTIRFRAYVAPNPPVRDCKD